MNRSNTALLQQVPNNKPSASAADDASVRVLVVDDMPDIVETLTALLEWNGYTVRSASGGAAALAVAEEFHPHCVLMDIQMPGMDGQELSRQFRRINGDSVVLIAMTGHALQSGPVQGTFALVDHYLRKPFDIDKLEKVLPPLPGAGGAALNRSHP